MSTVPFRRLLLALDVREQTLRDLFSLQVLGAWHIIDCGSVERAKFLQQMDPCDVVLIDQSLVRDSSDLAWLMGARKTPVVVLGNDPPARKQHFANLLAEHWLPRQLALDHPALLALVINQAGQVADLHRVISQRDEALQSYQRQVQRLVGMLWHSIPLEARTPWFTQRHMIDRLDEEVTRCLRHGNPLTVVLGELRDSPRQRLTDLPPEELVSWTAKKVGSNKRRYDVVGQYGPNGFMLLLPHTTATGAIDLCRRLQPLLENPHELPSGARGPVGVRFGMATCSSETATVKSLLGRAEQGLEGSR